MTRPVLAATDLTPASQQAAERAALLGAAHGWPLTLLHVLNLKALERLRGLFSQAPEQLSERLQSEAREELEQLAAELSERHGAHIGLRVCEGAVSERILAEADTLDPQLLVLGSHGERPLRHGLIGSVTERVLHGSAHPLLVVKAAPRGRYRRVLVPVDLSARSLPALRQASQVAPDADLVLLHAYDIPFESQLRRSGMAEDELSALLLDLQQRAGRKMDQLIDDSGLPSARLARSVLHGEPGRRILEQQQARDCDLIVLGRRDLGRVQSWLLGSVGNHVLAQADCDVLLVNGLAD